MFGRGPAPAPAFGRSAVFTTIRRGAAALARAIPTAAVCAALGGLFWWGHATHWKAPRLSELLGERAATDDDDAKRPAPAAADDDRPRPSPWCEKHQVPDDQC